MNTTYLDEFIDDLETTIRQRCYSGGHIWNDEVIETLKVTLANVKQTKRLIINAEKFLEGDYGENAFLAAYKEINENH